MILCTEYYKLCPISTPSVSSFSLPLQVMIAYLPDMKEVCEKYSVPLTVHIGKGMMHCWGGAMEFVPEAKTVRQEYFLALR